MAPPPPAQGATARRATAPQSRPSTRNPRLRVLTPEPRRTSRRTLSPRGGIGLGVATVVLSLLMVVVGDALVAQGQVRMAGLQSRIDAQVAIQKAAQTQVADLAAPVRVVAEAISAGMVAPTSVTDLPQVPLDVPLPLPDTSPLPPPPRPATVPTAPKPATTVAASTPAPSIAGTTATSIAPAAK